MPRTIYVSAGQKEQRPSEPAFHRPPHTIPPAKLKRNLKRRFIYLFNYVTPFPKKAPNRKKSPPSHSLDAIESKSDKTGGRQREGERRKGKEEKRRGCMRARARESERYIYMYTCRERCLIGGRGLRSRSDVHHHRRQQRFTRAQRTRGATPGPSKRDR